LREERVELEMPVGDSFDSRLDAVMLTIYLLFNEGYYSASPDAVLRKDLCLEAMRLCFLLTLREGPVRKGQRGRARCGRVWCKKG